jgi:5S rRNA maturation endonuclease (ribonuclease M5)
MAEQDSGTTIWPEFLEVWERFRQESAIPGTTVVVEGERDRRSLRRLGVRGPIALVHRGQSLSALSNDLARGCRRVIVMTDWDLEGGQIAHRLERFLSNDGVAFDLDFRRRFAILLRGELTHVEGLFGWARRTAERAGAPLEHFVPPTEEPP